MKEKNTRVLSVGDHDLVLQGLKRIVERSLPEIKTVYTASSEREVLLLIASQCFNLFLLDTKLSNLSGLEIISRIREKDPQARIVMNVVYEEIWFIRNLIQCDVDSILFKFVDSSEIIEAICCVFDGGTYYCAYAEQVRNQMRRSDEGRCEELAQRELDVLKCISEGKNIREVVQDLCVSANMVDAHRRHLLDKLGAKNVAGLIVAVVSRGIIPIRKCR